MAFSMNPSRSQRESSGDLSTSHTKHKGYGPLAAAHVSQNSSTFASSFSTHQSVSSSLAMETCVLN